MSSTHIPVESALLSGDTHDTGLWMVARTPPTSLTTRSTPARYLKGLVVPAVLGNVLSRSGAQPRGGGKLCAMALENTFTGFNTALEVSTVI